MRSPKAAKLLLLTLLGGGTTAAGAATWMGVGVAPPEEPQGISLRQESARSRAHGFFYAYRSHRGGGLRGGK